MLFLRIARSTVSALLQRRCSTRSSRGFFFDGQAPDPPTLVIPTLLTWFFGGGTPICNLHFLERGGGGSEYVSYLPLRYQKYMVLRGGPSAQINVMQDLEGRKLHLFAPLPPFFWKISPLFGGREGGLPGQGGAGWPLKYPRSITIQDIIQICRFYVCVWFNLTFEYIWAASKATMKGFRIRVHVSNPPRKQNVHARKLRERSASRPSRENNGESS